LYVSSVMPDVLRRELSQFSQEAFDLIGLGIIHRSSLSPNSILGGLRSIE
jgi:hypothetical protein